jgi:hypothetical protein
MPGVSLSPGLLVCEFEGATPAVLFSLRVKAV